MALLDNFDWNMYFLSSTTDSERVKMRNDYIIKKFWEKFPSFSDMDRDGMIKLLSYDKSVKKWYKQINDAFIVISEIPSFFILSHTLTEEEKERVRLELEKVRKILKETGEKLLKNAEEYNKKTTQILQERDKNLAAMDHLTQVTFLTIEHVPVERKVELMKIQDENAAREKIKSLLIEFQKECVEKIRGNSGKWPENFNPLKE